MTLRSIRTILSLGGFLIASTPKRAKLRKLAETDPIEAAKLSHEYIKKEVEHLFEISGSTLEVKGLENIPTDQACLFAGNHLGFFDVIVLEHILPVSAGFIAKDSLQKIPGLSAWMELLRCLFLNRKDTKEGLKIIFKAADFLKEGYSMIIFPEGTRYREGELGEFKGASLKMAQKAKVPVVPFALTGTGKIFEENSFLSVKPSHVTITFGEPLLINALPRPEQKMAVEMVRNTVQTMINDALS
ncbi:MAG: lysophospholipid acyltransferase family protein [Eubacteriales bacterium]|nr:lysophospholipid acyltransferase family protein [Eubacteriales bacterium]